MTQQPEAAPVESGVVTFHLVDFWRRKSAWYMATSQGDAPLASLAGRTVSIGDKDGGIWEAVTVTSVDERTGDLTVTGGGFGMRFRDDEAAPFEGVRTIRPHDIARGFIHPAAVQS